MKERTKTLKRFDFDTLRAVNYFTATSWFKNFHTLTRKKVESDFALMKSVGINCVNRIFPGVYDNNILVESSEHDMKIIATFWMPDNIDFIRDSREMQKHVEEIKNTISKLRDQKQIVAWQCSPDVFARIKDSYWEKDIQKQYNAYLNYMTKIVNTIHEADPTRTIIVEIDADKDLREKIKACKSVLSDYDLVGLSVDKSKSLSKIDFSAIDFPYIINNCEVKKLKNITCPHKGIVFIEWQDRQNRDFVTLNGFIDFYGNKKDKLLAVQEFVKNETITTDLNNVKILKPCKEVWNGMNLEYNAVLMRDGKWLLVREMNENITCDWYLMQTDVFGNPLTFKYLDENPVLQLQVPAHPEMYKLLLLVKENGVVHTHTTLLNTPLVYSKKKNK